MMRTIEQLIGELLLQHNCVIVPSFGGFVAQPVSAKINFETGRAFPPSKSLLFNKQLINNDGLLINEFAHLNNLSFEASAAKIEAQVNTWNTTLIEGGRIELEKIGILYTGADNTLCFEQDRFFNLLLASFGLGKVSFEVEVQAEAQRIVILPVVPEIKVDQEVEEKIEEEEIKIIPHPALLKERTKIWKYIAAACFLPIAFYSVWLPMKTDVLQSGLVSMQDFNPFHTKAVAVYKLESVSTDFRTPESTINSFENTVADLPADISVYTYKYDDALFIPVRINDDVTTTTENTETATFTVNSMHFIVGCFGNKTNAVNLVEKLNNLGLNASIVDVKNGLHRVTAGGAISLEGLSKIREEAKKLGLSGWTLK